jgi:predicted nucleic acid-binding Zn ribbon protein
MKRSNQQSLKEALESLVDSFGLRAKLDEQAIREGWEKLAGAMIARHTTDLKLRKDTLYVKVDSAPLRHELGFMRSALVELINRELGRVVVKDVHLD